MTPAMTLFCDGLLLVADGGGGPIPSSDCADKGLLGSASLVCFCNGLEFFLPGLEMTLEHDSVHTKESWLHQQ
jgi:hypothetical protein